MQHTIKHTFLLERLIELFHKDTLDSYRVRIHNTNSLLKELKTLIIGFNQNRVQRFETVKLCAEELKSSIQSDEFLDMDNYSKELFIEDVDILIKSSGKDVDLFQYIFILEKLIQKNKESYLQVLFEQVESLVFDEIDFTEEDFIPVIGKIDKIVSILASELINIGYSKSYIFYVLNVIKNKPFHEFKDNFEKFRDTVLDRNYIDFCVIFKIYLYKEENSVAFVSEFTDKIPDELLSEKLTKKYPKFINTANASKLVFYSVKALDSYNAIRKSKVMLSELFDKIHVGYNSLDVNVHSQALVIDKNDTGKVYLLPTNYSFDGIFESNEDLYNKYNALLETIKNNSNIEQDVKDRIYSALRYLRLGNNTVEIEQKFIDYWIALEFLFSSPIKEQNTYGRLKENMINILACGYVKRNLLFLNQALFKTDLIAADQLFWKLSDPELDAIRDSNIIPPLLRYRFQRTKSNILSNSDKRKKYTIAHINNLNQNLSRIYHLRNELIHEAALKQDIENITSNLRYYLVFVLNQMLVYFSNLSNSTTDEQKTYSMDDLFYEFKVWKRSIEKNYDKDIIMSVPIEIDLINKK